MAITPVEDGIFLKDVSDCCDVSASSSEGIVQSPGSSSVPPVELKDSTATASSAKTLRSGIVHSHGPGSKNYSNGKLQPMPCKIGDKVYIDKYADNWVEADGQKFLHIKPHNIVAKDSGDSGAGNLRKVQKANKMKELYSKSK